jgi:hypothetical protein
MSSTGSKCEHSDSYLDVTFCNLLEVIVIILNACNYVMQLFIKAIYTLSFEGIHDKYVV